MAKTWLIDSRTIARKVRNATEFSASQTKENEAYRECPNCNHRIDNSDDLHEWPGLPAGVKFDPSDVELLGHLAEKVGLDNSAPHHFINEFIPTLEGDDGICHMHPKNLRGVKKDGSSVYFFHRSANAYATGHRKRRKIQNQHISTEEAVRWHKTGKTKSVRENGVHKGWKKIMVLYKSSKKGLKPEKLNWVMYQYHLGMKEDEKEGEYVVSKIFYQQQRQKQNDKSDTNLASEESDNVAVDASPKTPKTNTPYLHRPRKRPLFDEDNEDNESEFTEEVPESTLHVVNLDDNKLKSSRLAGESQAVADPDATNDMDESLLCNEILDSHAPIDNPGVRSPPYFPDFNNSQMDAVKDVSMANGVPDLDGIDLDTPPEFQLADLQFGSEESIMNWLDQIWK